MQIKININSLPQINRIVKFFILSDLMLWSGWGFIDPLFSIFVVEKISGSTLVSVGILATIYWLTKGVLQIPISLFLDKTDGERDDFYALIIGLLIGGGAAISLSMAQTINQVYAIQFIKAIGFALYIPSWSAIVSRHLDKDHTAFEWALSSSTVSFGIAIAGLLGSLIASSFGFRFLFILTGLFAMVSVAVLLFVPEFIFPRKTTPKMPLRDHIQIGIK